MIINVDNYNIHSELIALHFSWKVWQNNSSWSCTQGMPSNHILLLDSSISL